MNKHTIILNDDDYVLIVKVLQDIITDLEKCLNKAPRGSDMTYYAFYQYRAKQLLKLIIDNNENQNEN